MLPCRPLVSYLYVVCMSTHVYDEGDNLLPRRCVLRTVEGYD